MEKKIKIAFVVTKGDRGGAQKYVKQLVFGLNKEKFEPIIISGSYGEALKMDRKLKWLGNKSGFLFYRDILALFELARILKKEELDVVHLNSSKGGVIGALAGRLAGVSKIVFTAHGWVFSDESLPWIKKCFYIWLHRVAGIFQDAVINVSEYDRKLALKYKIVSEKKMKVIWNGIDMKNFDEEILDRVEARKFFEEMDFRFCGNDKQNKDKKVWVESVGRLVKEKNYNLLIEVINGLKIESENEKQKKIDFHHAYRQADHAYGRQVFHENDNEVKLVIIGEGEERKMLEEKIKSLGLEESVILVGEISNAYKYLKAFDLFVLPSRKEGMPYTLIEAMVAGVPVLTSRVGGMTEIVGESFTSFKENRDKEERGYLFESGNKKELAEKIEYILENKEEVKRKSEEAKKFAEENLSEGEMIRKTENIYINE